MKTKQNYLVVSLLTVVSALLLSCGSGEKQVLDELVSTLDESTISVSKEQFEAMKMEWGKLDSGLFSKSILVQGSVQVPVESMQEVTTFYGGYVSGMELLEGQQVRKGEILFYLENQEFILLQQNYLEAKSQLNYLKEEYQRQKTLYDEKIASQKNFLKAEAEYQSTLAKSESLKRQLGLLKINTDQLEPTTIRSRIPVYSPIAGFVTEIHAVPGSFIQPTDIAVSLISKDHLHMELMVFEKDVNAVMKEQEVEVRIPELSSEMYLAKVFMVGQSINEARQINVHAHLVDESKEAMLLPGMFIEGRILTDPKKGVFLPQSAVIQSDGKSYALLLREQTGQGFLLEKVEVQTGIVRDNKVEILMGSGLSLESQLLIRGGFNLM